MSYISYFTSIADIYLKQDDGRIGRKYKKAVYREYTDGTFKQQKKHSASLGILGPTLRVNVNEKVIIHFKNLASRPYSINVHGGLLKDKSSSVRNAKQFEGN